GTTPVPTRPLPMLLTEARCMRMTSRNGSRLMYQPGQAAPGMRTGETPAPTLEPAPTLKPALTLELAPTLAGMRTGETPAPTLELAPTLEPRLVSARPFFVGSVAGTSGSQSSAIRDDCRYASPHMMAVTQAA